MFYVEHDKVYITKGDYGKLNVDIVNDEDEPYDLQTGDVVTLTVRETPGSLSKILEINSVISSISFNHDDTKDIEPGQYSADIQVRTANGKRFTIWPTLRGDARHKNEKNIKNFIVMPEVTTE